MEPAPVIPREMIPLDGIDLDRMLEFWRWLVPSNYQPLFATALGDLFLTDQQGQILWLEMGSGELEAVASSEKEFWRAVADPENGELWLGRALVNQLRAAGRILGPGQCYCYWKLPMLGGEYEPANFRVHDLITHFRIWGPIHEQLRDLPDGTQVTIKVEHGRGSEAS